MAFANTLQAVGEGTAFVDASIYGMGRGAGNLPLEVLIGFLEKQKQKKYNAVPLLDIIEHYYTELFKQYNWGYQIKSLLGGLSNIHPYYVDEIYGYKNYTLEEIWNTLAIIKKKCPISYSSDNLKTILNERFYKPLDATLVKVLVEQIRDLLTVIPASDAFTLGKFELTNKWKGRKFLIIGNGTSIIKYQKEIVNFVKKENCITIGLNFLQDLYKPDYHIFVNKKRFQKYVTSISPSSILILPSFFGKEWVHLYWEKALHYMDINIIEDVNHIPIENEQQYIVNLNVAISAILLAVQMGASKIYAVGIDGYIGENSSEIQYFYNENDIPEDKNIASIRYEKFVNELERVNNYLLSLSIPFSIITPTSHKRYYNHNFN
jgi:4-hydroxy 2-oxovalerate aldolase